MDITYVKEKETNSSLIDYKKTEAWILLPSFESY